jgi:hypothetical protein
VKQEHADVFAMVRAAVQLQQEHPGRSIYYNTEGTLLDGAKRVD